ncbi:acyltransferase [Mycobacterium sp. MYCO198283]|uniref:acyltransferase family protein n=1 Tax=Mycobacterium sp. MYCO198283 TaxID=2883505 RepID=UPI001E499A11|nr:acyltransferase [Mycobacterium sp. MYCO198283]MCG5430817.1 acyltransferase [Mycobacterium sp. MYCO198283]
MASSSFPTVAQVESRTPPSRDRAIDTIRIAALVTVVFGHTVMATSTVRDGLFVWGNLLTASVIFQALTWVLQIMPLFFFAGAAACVDSWTPGTPWGGWLLRRCTRLYRPVFYYLAGWAVMLVALHLLAPPLVYRIIAGISTQLLWFLGAYVLMLAALPLLARITGVRSLAAVVVGGYALIAAVDYARVALGAPAALGYLNMVVWLIPGALGVAYRRELLSRTAAAAVAGGAFVVNLGLLAFGPYELSLVGIEGQRLANMAPPSLLMAGHAIVLCAAAVAAAPAIDRWARRPRVWWWVAIGNSGAMTLYLWHMPALLGMHLAFDYLGYPRHDPAAASFVVLSVVQVCVMALLTGALFVALRPWENAPLPGWDGGRVAAPGWRSAAVGIALCVAGCATLMSVRWGLAETGQLCVAVMLGALAVARVLARDGVTARREASRRDA